MKVFQLRQRLIQDYGMHARSFIEILEIYDATQASIRTGQPDQTRRDPPPADPRCCHPARQ